MLRITLLLVVGVLAGCTSLNPEGRTASPSPSALPSGVANLAADEELAPGRYAFRGFGEPLVTFEVEGDPWKAVQLRDGFFDIQRGEADDPDVIAVRVANKGDKEALLAADSDKFFTEPHYNGFPAILVRLAAIDPDELEELLVDAWRCMSPAALVKAYDAGSL